MIGSILIVARNNLHLTKKAIISALDQDTGCDVIVVDNASTDGSSKYLSSKGPISLISYTRQQSLSTCWNVGLETIWRFSLSPVLVLNNDVEIRPDMYRRLYNLHRSFVTGVSVRTREEMERPGDELSQSPHPDFSCFMISQSAYEITGKFDVGYFPAFYEDNDYHIRMHRAGVHAISVDIPFLHHGSQTIKNADPNEISRIQRGADECRRRFQARYGCLPGTPEYDALFSNGDISSLR